MTIETLIVYGMITVIGLLLTMLKIFSFKFVLKYAGIIDVLATLGFMYIMKGTATGILTAMVAGLILAVTLSFMRVIADYMKYDYRSYRVIRFVRKGKEDMTEKTTYMAGYNQAYEDTKLQEWSPTKYVDDPDVSNIYYKGYVSYMHDQNKTRVLVKLIIEYILLKQARIASTEDTDYYRRNRIRSIIHIFESTRSL